MENVYLDMLNNSLEEDKKEKKGLSDRSLNCLADLITDCAKEWQNDVKLPAKMDGFVSASHRLSHTSEMSVESITLSGTAFYLGCLYTMQMYQNIDPFMSEEIHTDMDEYLR